MKNKNNVHPLLHALLPVGIALLYILIGFTFDTGWAIGWILFLLIPIIETLINAINTKDASKFAYPVFLAAIFLFTGMMWGWWHPMWVVFVTIPAYYAIADYVKKSKTQDQEEMAQDVNAESNQGTYYQPPVDVQPQQKKGLSKGGIVAIVITSIVAFAVVACVAIVSTFSWLGGSFDLPIHFHAPAIITTDADDSYTMGNAELATDDIERVDIEWIDGNVNIEYYDGDKIIITEDSNVKYPMCYKVEGKYLLISEYKGSKKTKLGTKNLEIKLPNDFYIDELSFGIVSANVNASELNVGCVEVDTVSGNANLSFSKQPMAIDIESVSGDVNVQMPKDFSGYYVSKSTISGEFRANDFGNKLEYGDGYIKIGIESVSGNLIINKK